LLPTLQQSRIAPRLAPWSFLTRLPDAEITSLLMLVRLYRMSCDSCNGTEVPLVLCVSKSSTPKIGAAIAHSRLGVVGRYSSFAYSALACLRMGMSVSASSTVRGNPDKQRGLW
jgi:hypothetical protein